MNYNPKINDYVRWKKSVEGWVYFLDKEYITIEVSVRPKTCENYQACCLHRNERVLVVCYKEDWKELVYVKSRSSTHEEKKEYVEIMGKVPWRESIKK